MRCRLHAGFALLATLLTAVACGPDSALLIVEVTGRPAVVQSLRLLVKLNDKQVIPAMQVTSSLDSFGLLLPPEPSGAFMLTADGLDNRACAIAQGHTSTTLTGRDRVRLTLPMTMLQLPVCPQ